MLTQTSFVLLFVLSCLSLVHESHCRPYWTPSDNTDPSFFCGQLWDKHNFCGDSIQLGKNEIISNVDFYQLFVARSGYVSPNCSLSLYSRFAPDIVFVNTTSPWLWQCWDRTVSSVCCECGSCSDAVTPSGDDSCAVVYQHEGCRICNGDRLEVNDNGEFKELGVVNNKISSVIVKPGCQLSIYDETNFQGNFSTVTDTIELLDEQWNDKISSLKCLCGISGANDSTTDSTPTSFATSSELTPSSSPVTIPSTEITSSPSTIPEITSRPSPSPTPNITSSPSTTPIITPSPIPEVTLSPSTEATTSPSTTPTTTKPTTTTEFESPIY